MSLNSQMIKKSKPKRKGQVVVEAALLLALMAILGISVFKLGRAGIYQFWYGMKNQIDGPCAKCTE
jgi:hypothetical protein